MHTIQKNCKNELVIKNSRFITLLYRVQKEEEILPLLKQARFDYPKATHYTYAYRIEKVEKSSDDGEPGGTAGMPILNVLQKQELTNILAIVIRYFGGIKLGAGGLVRAYSKSCQEALLQTEILSLVPAYKVKIVTDYSKEKDLNHLLQKEKIEEKIYTETITYLAILEHPEKLDNHFSYQILESTFLEK